MEQGLGGVRREKRLVHLGKEWALSGLITDGDGDDADDDNSLHAYYMPGTMVDDFYKLS